MGEGQEEAGRVDREAPCHEPQHYQLQGDIEVHISYEQTDDREDITTSTQYEEGYLLSKS